MGDIPSNDNFDDYAITSIKLKVRQLIKRCGFDASDREDMEQELALHLFQHLQEYDPERGTMKTFIVCVVENKARIMIRVRNRRIKNLDFPLFSLNEEIPEEDGFGVMQRVEAIDGEDYLLRTGLLSRPTMELLEMRVDIERILDTLPQSLREICERLKTQNVTQISAETGASRQQVYEMIRKLRGIFDEAGLKDYL
ncbi:MAG: sigma factor [Armatimonadota bacterium]